MDKKSLAVSKKYTEDSLDGVGALKGVPCEILSIENNDDGTHTITYQWTSNSGKVLQDTMIVKDGDSAYALAVESGYEGTLEEWLLSLKGDKGDSGDKGDKGDKGDMGYGIPEGGLTGQVITKKSGTDFDLEWQSLGDASKKAVTTYVSPDDNDVPTSAAVYRAMSAMLTGAFHPSGEKTVAELTSALLIEANLGNCYLITDSGVTDANWFGGAGQTIEAGNMAVVNRASDSSFKFQLQKGINIDTSAFQEKTLSTPITVDGVSKTTVEDTLDAINTLAASNKTALAGKVSTSLTSGLLKNDGTVDETDYQEQTQFASMPTASADYLNKIVQFVGTTSASYTNGYFYKCVQDGSSYSWTPAPTQSGGGGGTGGHTIKDDGTAMTSRAGLNFTDFDLSDDSTNDETEVKPHELTSAEMAEIMSTLPGTPTDLPILFDERGTEYVVGYYVDSNGLKKPVYEKTIVLTTKVDLSSNTWEIVGSDNSISDIVNGIAYSQNGDSKYVAYPVYTTIVNGDIKFLQTRNTTMEVFAYAIRYTKTTDTPS